jgi:hypothetical protein
MEELTKQQIVLVTLLVSFVTSIATGIVTVALMDQAPPGITQTVNRVVERTIEKIVPAQNQAASVITKETVVVKEDDLVVKAVEQNAKSLVAIFAFPAGGDVKSEKFVGNGLIVSKDGLIATDSETLSPVFDANYLLIPQNFKAVLNDGTALSIVPATSTAPGAEIAILKVNAEKEKLPTFVPASIADATALKLGQTVIALGGEKISVDTGIVSSLSGNAAPSAADGAASATSTTAINAKPRIIKTNILSDGKILGSILVNLSGDVVGIKTVSAGSADNPYLSASAITKMLSKPSGTNAPKQ